MFDMVMNTPQSSVLLTSDHTSTLDPQWLRKRLLDRLRDQIVVTTINGTPDVVTFLETTSRILHNLKKDKVTRNALLLLTFSRIILTFPSVLKSYPYFPIYGQNRRFLPYTNKCRSEKTSVMTYFTQCLI